MQPSIPVYQPNKKRTYYTHLIERLLCAVLYDKTRVITYENDCEIWSLPSNENIFWDGVATQRLIIPSEWSNLYNNLIYNHHHIVHLYGKSGRGKSLFLRYMIIRMLEDMNISNDITIAYVIEESTNTNTKFWITKYNITVINDILTAPDYLILDNVDSNLDIQANKLNLGVSSDDKKLTKFQKRLVESRGKGNKYAMNTLGFNEMSLIFPDMTYEELQFKYDMLGGNPRKLNACRPASLIYEVTGLLFPILQECLYIYYNKEYNYEYNTVEGRLARWIIYVITNEVGRHRYSDCSLFRAEFKVDNNNSSSASASATNTTLATFATATSASASNRTVTTTTTTCSTTSFSSNFLKLVVSAMLSLQNDYLYTAIHDITGRTYNYNYSHIYLTHYALLNTHSLSFPCGLNKNREVELIPILLYKQKTTRLIRNIEDLKYLSKQTNNNSTATTTTTDHSNDNNNNTTDSTTTTATTMHDTIYNIPTMFNFLGVDAIISTYLIQIAINNQYQEINQLFNISQVLNIEVKDLTLIFVVERMEDVWDFQFPDMKDMKAMKMFVIPRNVCNEEQLRSSSNISSDSSRNSTL